MQSEVPLYKNVHKSVSPKMRINDQMHTPIKSRNYLFILRTHKGADYEGEET